MNTRDIQLTKKEVLDAVSRGVEKMMERWREEIWACIEEAVMYEIDKIATDNGALGDRFFEAIEAGASNIEFTLCQIQTEGEDE